MERGLRDIVVDACCLINLGAIADAVVWSSRLGMKFHVPRIVSGESLSLRATDADGNQIRRPMNLKPLTDAGILVACDVSPGAETDLFVKFARDLDDGEAMALAIARNRNWPVATDDRKGSRLAKINGIPVITTPDLVKQIADAEASDGARLAECLRKIQDHACFWPPNDHPLWEWWTRAVGRGLTGGR